MLQSLLPALVRLSQLVPPVPAEIDGGGHADDIDQAITHGETVADGIG